MNMRVVIAVLCIVLSYTSARPFAFIDCRVYFNVASSKTEASGSERNSSTSSRSGDLNFQRADSETIRQNGSYGDYPRSHVAQNGAPSRSENDQNAQHSGGNYGSYGTQNAAGSGSTTLKVDTNPNNCNVQAWNEQFEHVEGRAGFSNSGPHPNPVVRCHQETVVSSKDLGNGVSIQSTSTIGTGSYRSTIYRSTGDPGSEQLAKRFGAY